MAKRDPNVTARNKRIKVMKERLRKDAVARLPYADDSDVTINDATCQSTAHTSIGVPGASLARTSATRAGKFF